MPSTKTKRTHELRLKRSYAAAPAAIFKAFTDPLALRSWCYPAGKYTVPFAEADAQQGGRFRIVMRAPDGTDQIVSGLYSELRPPDKIVFTWAWKEEGGETLVSVEFREKKGGTDLVLTHELFPTKPDMTRHLEGWTGALARLKKHVEAKK